MRRQNTIAGKVSLSSPTICSEEETTLTLIPSLENTGIVFWRSDLDFFIAAAPAYVKNHNVVKWSCLQSGNARVEAIEHVMAALLGMNVDNVVVALDGEGVPILDGSARPFVDAILKAGIVEQDAPARFWELPESVVVHEQMVSFRTGAKRGRDSALIAMPCIDLRLSYLLQYDDSALSQQYVEFDITPTSFAEEIAPARTFMTPWEIERWGPGGSGMLSKYFCDIVPVVSDTEVFAERTPNEAAKHKVLDMLGDLAVLGPITGSFIGIRSGHSLNGEMVRRLHWTRLL